MFAYGSSDTPPSGACAVYEYIAMSAIVGVAPVRNLRFARLLVEHAEELRRDVHGPRVIERKAEQLDRARCRRPGRELTRRHGEPLLNAGGGGWLARIPGAALVVAGREVDKNRVAVRDSSATILDHGYLAERILAQEVRLLLLARNEVHVDELQGQAQQ